MTDRAAFRGQPLVLLAALLVGWVVVRMLAWPHAPLPGVDRLVPPTRMFATAPGPRSAPTTIDRAAPAEGLKTIEPFVPPPLKAPRWAPLNSSRASTPLPPLVASAPARLPVRAVVGHNLLLAAGFSQLALPPSLAAFLEAAQPATPAAPVLAAPLPPPRLAAAAASRWSADGWLLWRHDTTAPLGAGAQSYGRSQAGAVVRYELAPASRLRPQAYVRVAAALAGAREEGIATGLSLRAPGPIPLRLAIEGRPTRTDQSVKVRPAAFAVTELPPVALPYGARAVAYAQAGYVGGSAATAFIDGQARVARTWLRRGAVELSAGVGAWGGAQRGAARLDVGPSAAVSFRLGEGFGRVAADYRLRVAGDAQPASGPALTVSAGF
jgi:hypothetical protein